MTKLLESALRKGSKAASVALPKGNAAQLYRPTEITFPTVKRQEKALPVETAISSGRETIADAAALSDALLLESLRYGRYLEVQVSE